jgi:hypothetical protein
VLAYQRALGDAEGREAADGTRALEALEDFAPIPNDQGQRCVNEREVHGVHEQGKRQPTTARG